MAAAAKIEVDRHFDRGWGERQEVWGDLLSSKPPPLLYHYTNAQGLIGIVQSGKFWATDIRHLNDPYELRYSAQRMSDARYEIERKYSNLMSYAASALRDLSHELEEGFKIYLRAYKVHVVCFCEDGDLLSQWRGYGANADGFAIGFDTSGFKRWSGGPRKPRMDFRKISYSESALENIISTATDRAFAVFKKRAEEDGLEKAHKDIELIRGYFTALTADATYVFKSPAFKEENEWRFIYTIFQDYGAEQIEYRVLQGRLTPYVPLTTWPPETIERLPIRQIVFGPTLNRELTKRAVEGLLRKSGYKDVEVVGSRIPYRN